MLGILSRSFGETILPTFSRIEIYIGSAEILFIFRFKIFCGVSMKITLRSSVNAYSKEIPDQSEIIHVELKNNSDGITPSSKIKFGFLSNFFFNKSINLEESLNNLK